LTAPAVSDLLRRVRLLELVARRNAAGPLRGDYLSATRGAGQVFHESRKYVSGEPVRTIDWNVTARLAEPYVKVHLEERQRDVVVALDVSPSMHTGFQERSKLEFAVELAASLGASAIDGGDRLGWVFFADRALAGARPRGGRAQLFRFARALLEGAGPWDRAVAESDPRAAIHRIERWPGRFVVFLISDLIDHDLPEDLKFFRARHDVSLLHVYDPVEHAPAGPVRFRGFSPEGHGVAWTVRPGGTAALEEVAGPLRARASRRRMTALSIPTTAQVRQVLGGLFHRKRRELVR